VDKESKSADAEKKELTGKYKKIFDKITDKDKAIEVEENDIDDVTKDRELVKKKAKEREKKVLALENEVRALQAKVESSKDGDLDIPGLQKQIVRGPYSRSYFFGSNPPTVLIGRKECAASWIQLPDH